MNESSCTFHALARHLADARNSVSQINALNYLALTMWSLLACRKFFLFTLQVVKQSWWHMSDQAITHYLQFNPLLWKRQHRVGQLRGDSGTAPTECVDETTMTLGYQRPPNLIPKSEHVRVYYQSKMQLRTPDVQELLHKHGIPLAKGVNMMYLIFILILSYPRKYTKMIWSHHCTTWC